LSEEELQKQRKALQKLLKKESDLKTIVDANQTRFCEAALAQKEMTTGPDRKPAIDDEDDMKPAFSVGDYVKVDEDTSANMNRPEGFEFVQ
jgi:anti-sigma-K factor RskA